jgi:hypothetical protein
MSDIKCSVNKAVVIIEEPPSDGINFPLDGNMDELISTILKSVNTVKPINVTAYESTEPTESTLPAPIDETSTKPAIDTSNQLVPINTVTPNMIVPTETTSSVESFGNVIKRNTIETFINSKDNLFIIICGLILLFIISYIICNKCIK